MTPSRTDNITGKKHIIFFLKEIFEYENRIPPRILEGYIACKK